MSDHKQKLVWTLLGVTGFLFLIVTMISTTGAVGTLLNLTPVMDIYVPVVLREPTPTPTPPISDPQAYVNYFRGLAGVPAVSFDATLNDNCWQHARYMAYNNHLTHQQNSSLPYASPAGQVCAGNGNVWLGSEYFQHYWEPYHSIDSWMGSVGHRLWLLYPTTPTFGYGFHEEPNFRAGAALDVLSESNFGADTSYSGWPVRYPAPNQLNVPPSSYPITVNWRYFGPTPTLGATGLTTSGGSPIAHTANTNLPVNHKGVQILPSGDLPAGITFTVTVTGSYDGAPFSYTWQFSTESAAGY
jgi:hypothetical protein